MYAINDLVCRRDLWDKLKALSELFKPWMDDHREILWTLVWECNEFSGMVSDCYLTQLEQTSPYFT